MMEKLYLEGANCLKIAADIGGPEEGKIVILVHGGGQSRRSWRGTQKSLIDEGYRVISMDMRGHGESDWASNGAYHPDDFAADLKSIIGALASPPIIVGASLGGISGLLAVGSDKPAIARALVLVDVVPDMNRSGADRITKFMQSNTDGFESVEAVADAIAGYMPSRQRPNNLKSLEQSLRKRNGRYYWHWDPAMLSGGSVGKIEDAIVSMKMAARRVTIATLLVRGGSSDVVTPEGARELQNYIPQSEFTDVKGAGHMIAGDENDRFNQAVLDFLLGLEN